MGSKDNMTTLLVKLPAQTIGDGGGVMARRQAREAAHQAANARNEGEYDSRYT
jgi:hypothetical protein